jgi:hypothetical protein
VAVLTAALIGIAWLRPVWAEHPPEAFASTSRVVNTTLRLPLLPPEAVTDFPSTLADTGAFADLATLTPGPGLVPFELNVPLWSDGAHKTRWFYVPGTSQIGFKREGPWQPPVGTIWVKHFELELTNGVAGSRRRLETRFLVRTEAGVYGVTYRWGQSLTNAVLLDANGMDEELEIREGDAFRKQVWHYPARWECLACHSRGAGYSLGFNSAQFNRDVPCPGGPLNQIRRLNELGYFNTNITSLHTLRALAHATNTAVSVEYRVRSYLAANCVHCHQPEGICPTLWNAVLTNSLAETHLVNGILANTLGDAENRVIKPGDPAHSVLLQRISTRGALKMPFLCTAVVDTQGVALITAWITNDLPRYRTLEEWCLANFGSVNLAAAAPGADPDADGAGNALEYLTGTDPQRGGDAWRISLRAASGRMQIGFPQIANRGFEVQWTTNLADPGSWQALDLPGNRPFFSAVNREFEVVDPGFTPSPESALQKFYRVRVFEP